VFFSIYYVHMLLQRGMWPYWPLHMTEAGGGTAGLPSPWIRQWRGMECVIVLALWLNNQNVYDFLDVQISEKLLAKFAALLNVPKLCFILVEQGLTSHSTQFRSFRRQCFYRSDDPTNSVKALKEGG